MSHKIEFELGGRTMVIETGKIAKQANGAVTVQYGDSMVVSTVCSSTEPRVGLDFFPLTVEYREKAYAAGKIPGGFFKREARPSEKEILSARIIDRPIRPLFPDDFKSETQCINFIISHDRQNDTDLLALNGTSAAIAVSNVPFAKTVGGVRVGRIDGEFVVNPTFEQLEESDMNVIVAGSADSIAMVEGSGEEISEDELVNALNFAHGHIKTIVAKIDELKATCGKEKFVYTPSVIDETLSARATELVGNKLNEFNQVADKDERRESKKQLTNEIIEKLEEEFPECSSGVKTVVHDLDSASMRGMILDENKRIDGRGPDDIRDISCEVGLLPRAHGSALFTRGQTQALVAITLGTKIDEQRIDDLEAESTKSYMLHYNFPPFCVGEARPIRGTSRREVGHGNLAERAMLPIIPSDTSFPYTLRVVSDVMESNGSSSMASVCGASLALMDAGVPTKTAVAGIAMGLIKEGDKLAVLTDILGDEDHFGDMDFKVTGTAEGITAVQMDIKIDGLDIEIMREALGKAKTARLKILDVMKDTISRHRDDLSAYAPRIMTLQINPSKIGDLIGPGGKNIRAICEETGAKIDIEDDGTVLIATIDGDAAEKAKERVLACVEEAEVGKTYNGTVRRITNFGAFIEVIPGTDGLLHISEVDHRRIDRVEDVLKLGERVDVKVISVDGDGKIRLSRKILLENNGENGNDREDRRDEHPRGSSRPRHSR